MDQAVPDLTPIFSGHLETLGGAVRSLRVNALDEAIDPPGSFDEDGSFFFATVGMMILSMSGFIHFLAGEASMIRLALGKPACAQPIG